MHGREHDRTLPHGEIVVAAPNRDLADLAIPMQAGTRKNPDPTLDVGKDAIASLALESLDLLGKKAFVIHEAPQSLPNI